MERRIKFKDRGQNSKNGGSKMEKYKKKIENKIEYRLEPNKLNKKQKMGIGVYGCIWNKWQNYIEQSLKNINQVEEKSEQNIEVIKDVNEQKGKDEAIKMETDKPPAKIEEMDPEQSQSKNEVEMEETIYEEEEVPWAEIMAAFKSLENTMQRCHNSTMNKLNTCGDKIEQAAKEMKQNFNKTEDMEEMNGINEENKDEVGSKQMEIKTDKINLEKESSKVDEKVMNIEENIDVGVNNIEKTEKIIDTEENIVAVISNAEKDEGSMDAVETEENKDNKIIDVEQTIDAVISKIEKTEVPMDAGKTEETPNEVIQNIIEGVDEKKQETMRMITEDVNEIKGNPTEENKENKIKNGNSTEENKENKIEKGIGVDNIKKKSKKRIKKFGHKGREKYYKTNMQRLRNIKQKKKHRRGKQKNILGENESPDTSFNLGAFGYEGQITPHSDAKEATPMYKVRKKKNMMEGDFTPTNRN